MLFMPKLLSYSKQPCSLGCISLHRQVKQLASNSSLAWYGHCFSTFRRI